LSGIKIYTDPNNVTPIRKIQTVRFEGKSWILFGDILGERWAGSSLPLPGGEVGANGSREMRAR
jgi:hypothetical protein